MDIELYDRMAAARLPRKEWMTSGPLGETLGDAGQEVGKHERPVGVEETVRTMREQRSVGTSSENLHAAKDEELEAAHNPSAGPSHRPGTPPPDERSYDGERAVSTKREMPFTPRSILKEPSKPGKWLENIAPEPGQGPAQPHDLGDSHASRDRPITSSTRRDKYPPSDDYDSDGYRPSSRQAYISNDNDADQRRNLPARRQIRRSKSRERNKVNEEAYTPRSQRGTDLSEESQRHAVSSMYDKGRQRADSQRSSQNSGRPLLYSDSSTLLPLRSTLQPSRDENPLDGAPRQRDASASQPRIWLGKCGRAIQYLGTKLAAFLGSRPTSLFILICVAASTGIISAFSVMVPSSPDSGPAVGDSNFYTNISSSIVSVCSLYYYFLPFLRGEDPYPRGILIYATCAFSLATTIAAPLVYTRNSNLCIWLTYMAGFSQVTATALLFEDVVSKNPSSPSTLEGELLERELVHKLCSEDEMRISTEMLLRDYPNSSDRDKVIDIFMRATAKALRDRCDDLDNEQVENSPRKMREEWYEDDYSGSDTSAVYEESVDEPFVSNGRDLDNLKQSLPSQSSNRRWPDEEHVEDYAEDLRQKKVN